MVRSRAIRAEGGAAGCKPAADNRSLRLGRRARSSVAMGGRGEEDGGRDGGIGWAEHWASGDTGRLEMGAKGGAKEESSSWARRRAAERASR